MKRIDSPRVHVSCVLTVCVMAAVTAGSAPASRASASGDDPSSAPRVTGIWGQAENGATLSIVGSGFGTHSLDLSSSVGPSGWIESSPSGTALSAIDDSSGWGVGEASEASPPVVSEEVAYSGNHSALARVDGDRTGGWQSVLRYEHPRSFDFIYASWLIYFDPIRYSPHRHTQWKMWRINHNGTVRDQTGTFLSTSRIEPDGRMHNYQAGFNCALDCSSVGWTACNEKVRPVPFYEPIDGNPANYRYLDRAGTVPADLVLPSPRRWNRVELIVRRSSVDQHDGSLEVWITKPDRGRIFVDRQEGYLSRVSATDCRNPSDPWRYFMFQNYFDDDGSHGATLFTSERADVFYDDIYLQFGTRARVEIGNAPVHAECTRLEIQTPTAWSKDGIEVEVNHGAFEPGARVFLFVIDGDGTASPGFPLLLH